MKDRLMNKIADESFDLGEFCIYLAKYREIGADWSRIEYFPYYRLYYIYDSVDAHITLKSETVALLPGHMYYIPAFQIVSGSATNLKHSFIHFAPNLANINILEPYDKVIDITADADVVRLFNVVIERYSGGDVSDRFAASGSVQLLLSKCLKGKSQSNKERDKFRPVIDFINKNIDKSLTLQELADVLSYNKTYFGNCFKRVFGISPMQYVINKKVALACQLLTETDIAVREIAYSLGFENEFYFSRIFKIKTKKSPVAYRNWSR